MVSANNGGSIQGRRSSIRRCGQVEVEQEWMMCQRMLDYSPFWKDILVSLFFECLMCLGKARSAQNAPTGRQLSGNFYYQCHGLRGKVSDNWESLYETLLQPSPV